ncbi:hypothetical protein L873DRAFT_1804790 [Choiromyces venosus 120613-1]|uniref:Uncharacterized protein n=1 Tax=Choiromyces venosus 120613-1 TaxID=1336337 RepID=A0A3N4JQZ6_9PEZI|nr:hypothetical protein L873DRAFT_1804790 [Choiromyces venosus 120613-1]
MLPTQLLTAIRSSILVSIPGAGCHNISSSKSKTKCLSHCRFGEHSGKEVTRSKRMERG